MTIKFMYNGIKVDGTLYKAHYNGGPYTSESKIPHGTITIYASGCSFPHVDGLRIHNESDIMTDYFEYDTIRVTPNNAHYTAVKAALDKWNEHCEKRFAKRYQTA